MVLLTLILLTFVYLSFPKVFKIEVELKDFLVVNIKLKIIWFYVKIFHYEFPNKTDFRKVPPVKKKETKRVKLKASFKSFYKLFKIFCQSQL